jgi:hypothetical protein
VGGPTLRILRDQEIELSRGGLSKVKFQSVENTDRLEPLPWLGEREADLLVVRDRALKVVDKELWSERCHTRLHRAHRLLSLLLLQANVGVDAAARFHSTIVGPVMM